MKALFITIGSLTILGLAYALGPTPETPDYNGTVVRQIDELDLVAFNAKTYPGVKKGNSELLVYYGKDTPYSILYLHGFSASPEEGNPTHIALSKYFGWNLYAPLLHDHGLTENQPLLRFRADSAWSTAVKGLEKALAIGDSVVIVSTSTGGALATRLADICPRVAALVYYSPNVMPNDGAAFILNNPWGESIARAVLQSNYRDVEIKDSYYDKFWYRIYRIESLPEMQELVETGFAEDVVLRNNVPTYVAAWYENEEFQDDVVSVPHMRQFFNTIPHSRKKFDEFAASTHVIANGHYNPNVYALVDSTVHFLEQNGFRKVVADSTDL